MIDQNESYIAEQALKTALDLGASMVRVSLDKSVMDLVATLNGEVDRVTHCLDRSLTIALFVDGRYGSFSTNRLDEYSLSVFIAQAVDTVRMLSSDSCRALPSPERVAKDAASGRELGLWDAAYDSVTPQRRREIALDAAGWGRMAASDGVRIISEEGEYSDSEFDTLVIDSNGLRCRHTETSFEYGVEITIEDETTSEKYSGYWWHAAPFMADLDYASCARKALDRCEGQRNPKDFRGGKMNMVVDCEVASRLVTPILNALGGFALQQNNSFLVGSCSKKIFTEALTIVDRCRVPGQTGSRLFDSEGVATVEEPLVEKGVVKKYFINTYMSAKMGIAPTIEDAIRPKVEAWPREGLDRDSILGMCRNGILVTGFNGGNSNSATGDFSYGVEGFLFRDGKIVHPVREVVVTGNFIDLWNHLIAAGSDARSCMSRLIPTLAFSDVDFSS